MRAALFAVLVALVGCGKRADAPKGDAPGGAPAVKGDARPTVERMADLAGKKGQVVTLTGVVNTIGGQSTSDFVVILSWSAGTQVTCFFSTDSSKWYSTVENGAKFTVRGEVFVLAPNIVNLRDCEYLGSPR